jgi:hypothetical protein
MFSIKICALNSRFDSDYNAAAEITKIKRSKFSANFHKIFCFSTKELLIFRRVTKAKTLGYHFISHNSLIFNLYMSYAIEMELNSSE